MHGMSFTAHRRAVLLGLAGAALAPGARARTQAWSRTGALLSGYVSAGKVAGIALAVRQRHDAPVFSSYGKAAFDGPAADERTLWRIFSMTKPITGVAALALMEEGKLRLAQPVADFVPEFAHLKVLENGATRPARTPMLVSHLMTHTAGLGYSIMTGTPLAALYTAATLVPGDPTPRPEGPQSLDAFGARLAAMPLQSDPGTAYSYSVGLDLLGLVIQRASGVKFETYLKSRLFDPLGMTDTGFHTDAAARLSQNYSVRPQGVVPLEPAGQSPYLHPPAYPSGGGGLLSSARDYDRFCAMLQNDGVLDGVRVLSKATARRAHSNLLPAGVIAEGGLQFGAGMGIVTKASAHPGEDPPGAYGWAGAAGTSMWIDPVHRLSVVMMTQYMPSSAYPLWSDLRRAIYADLAAA